AGIWGPPRTIAAEVLVRPADTGQVASILSICNELDQSVVIHGGLTGVVDGAWAENSDVVLSLERLAGVENIDPVGATLIAGAGTTLATVQDAAAEHGLMFPLDMGARGTATIGGNVATNAGGNRVIRYGMVRSLVLGLEVVLADGTVLSSMNQMIKNNAGYDLKQLFIGTEGTLGVVTRVIVRLLPQPGSRGTALVAIDDFDRVTRFLGYLHGACGGTLSAYEIMWHDYYSYMTQAWPALLPPDSAYYVLVELLGSDPARDGERFITVLDEAQTIGLIDTAVIAKSGAEEDSIWAIRDDVVRLQELKPMFLFDVSLPILSVEAYVKATRDALTEVWPDQQMFVFGHLGDGNIHLAISAGPSSGNARKDVEDLVYRPLGALGGSVSAEHGIGLEKKPYLDWCRSSAEIRVMKALKKTLDPKRILNPGKVFD
ncbi:MAG: FAD-binding oxidoreductase, partial [Chromatiales bacterium]|nr:FAD-binding oxidoreductase [Chromatiales bacterium]